MAADMSNHTTATPARLDDFGERIEGARKHRPRTSPDAVTKAPSTPRTRKPLAFRIGRWRTRTDWMIHKRAAGETIELAVGFVTVDEARAYRQTHHEELTAEWDRRRLAADPILRRADNRERIGPPVAWDGNPDALLSRFGLRGVEFGRWVPNAERHGHVRAAVVAFTDLADALCIAPDRLGFGGTLGLAFGARGSGLFSAHYERAHRVVNLTRTRGAGSIGHEWFHGLDHALGGDALTSSAVTMPRWTRLSRPPTRSVFERAVEPLPDELGAFALAVLDSPVHERTRRADQFRSGAYHSRLEELVARAFESTVVAALADQGRVSDYLANIHPDSPVYLTTDEARPLIPLVRAVAATLRPSTETPTP